MKVVIVGGVAGGAGAAARLRRNNEDAEIILLERGGFISFANCGLPYYIGDIIKEKSDLLLQTPKAFHQRFNVDVRVRNEVLSANTDEKKLTVKNLDTGDVYEESYDKLILSPGARPIRPKIDGADSAQVFTLRNMEDTFEIKDYLSSAQPKTAAVIGGGYIGLEMADNLREAGLGVSVIEAMPHVIGPLDVDMAAEVQNHIRAKGVNLYCGGNHKRRGKTRKRRTGPG